MDITSKMALRVFKYYKDLQPGDNNQILYIQSVVHFTRLIADGSGYYLYQTELFELAALLHDIGSPTSIQIYGDNKPVHRQAENRRIVTEWMANYDGISDEQKKWLIDVVGSISDADAAQELRFQPLYEAIFLAKLASGSFKIENVLIYVDRFVKTAIGKKIFNTLIS